MIKIQVKWPSGPTVRDHLCSLSHSLIHSLPTPPRWYNRRLFANTLPVYTRYSEVKLRLNPLVIRVSNLQVGSRDGGIRICI